MLFRELLKLDSFIIINLRLLSLSDKSFTYLRMHRYFTSLLFLGLLLPLLMAGQSAFIEGTVEDENNMPVELANVAILGEKTGTTTDEDGYFKLKVPAEKDIILAVSYIGFSDKQMNLHLKSGAREKVRLTMVRIATNLPGFEVKDERLGAESLIRLDPKNVSIAPTMQGGVEAVIITLPGVSSNNELSSQYSVRGGNFDENLVYVNDIEIYRPFLVSSGQQEGLSFINSALVSSILFSAGGFGAEYGDKMASVLDVKYKKPNEFGGNVSLSFLGAELSAGGTAAKDRVNFIFGGRYKTNKYILNSLDTKGNYEPDFYDFQSLVNVKLADKWDLSFLGYYSRNQYKVIPTDRETDFGTFQEVYRFKVYFEGQEIDKYEMAQGGLTLSYRPNKYTNLRLIASAFHTDETETYDILGQYWIGLVQSNGGSEDFGEVVQTTGVGSFLEHARNHFVADVLTLEHKGSVAKSNNFLKWGIRYQLQSVDDRIREWEMLDSAGYSLPHIPDDPGNPFPANPDFVLNEFTAAHNKIQMNRFSAYVSDQLNFKLANKDQLSVTAGARLYYWDYNDELLFSPRLILSYKPHKQQNLIFRFATGYYYQPPFYRELRNLDGSIHENVRSQKSIHFILGSDLRFQAWNRPFIFTTELYYKMLDNLIPYHVDNVRVRYNPNQLAKGYAAGVDFKLYGEFVRGVDSWLSVSLMKTEEDIYNDFYYDYYNAAGEKISVGFTEDSEVADSLRVEPGYIPRPTDQRVNFSIFFQDYIPGHPYLKMHLRLLYGTGLPFGAPNTERYKHTLRMPDYRRVDIGFSYQFINEGSSFGPKNPFRGFKNMWISLEVFNLLQIYNTVSYIWIKDISNQQYAVPNYLTPRLLNLKLTAEF